MNPVYFGDYLVGSVRITFGRTITETDIVLHAGQSGDFYPHHMDAVVLVCEHLLLVPRRDPGKAAQTS
jgi:acyl dehydratase